MNTKIPFNKDRGIKGCMAESWKLIALNWKPYLQATLPYLLLMGVANALFFEIVLRYICEQAEPAYLLLQSGGEFDVVKWMATPNMGNAIYLTLSFLLFAFGNLCWTARLFSVIRHYKESDEMPTNLPLWLNQNEYKSILRTLYSIIAFTLVAFILCSPFIWLGLKWKPIAFAFLPLILIYISSACYHFVLKHALYFVAAKQSLVYSFKHALGFSFILLLLTSIPVGLCLSITSLPQAIYGLGNMAATQSTLMGDVEPLPKILPFLFFIINTVCYAFAALTSSYQVWCMSIKLNKIEQATI